MKSAASQPSSSPTQPISRPPTTSRLVRRTAVVRMSALMRENAKLRQTLASMRSLREMAYRDPLTGLWNRRFFEDRMAEELARARREPETPFTLVVVDVNNMKQINDTHGHEAGDRALRWVAHLLCDNLRAYDIAFRLGGDEFAMLLPGTRAVDAACLIARLRRVLAIANGSQDIPVGLSFGAATYRELDTTDLEIFVRADEAMYEDKRRQRQAV